MTWRSSWWIVLVFMVAFLGGYFVSYQAHSDPGDVQVVAGVDNASRLSARIKSKLVDGDEIAVVVAPASDANLLESYWARSFPGRVLLLAIGDDVYARANPWVRQEILDEKMDRVSNVNRTAGDRIVAMIAEIHDWQKTNEKPKPPPPPPPPPGPPEPPMDWHPILPWIYGGVPVALLVIFLGVQALRRHAKKARLASAADEQIDWSLDDYGITRDLK